MLENFICCLKSCINCYRLFIAESGEWRMEGEYGNDTDAVYERGG